VAPPPDRRDDDALVGAAATGDRDALDALLTRHVDRLHAVCRRVCGPDAAADATQQALLAITRSIARFDGRAAFTTWSHRIAVNAALDELRRSRRAAIPSSDRFDHDVVAAPAGLGPERVVDRLDLQAALAALPDDFRVAVVLRDVEDLDYADIAATLGVPIGTVRSRIARGRAALAAALGNRAPAPDVQGSDHG
jgi:RNA polymerase sigma-70 factor (ECF subfamily)